MDGAVNEERVDGECVWLFSIGTNSKKRFIMTECVAALRSLLKEKDLAAFIVPSADPHLSEYLAQSFQRRAFISGFTGSAGTAVVTESAAALWTDGRYFLQAEAELHPEFKLMRMGEDGTPSVEDWLSEQIGDLRVGVDPESLDISTLISLRAGTGETYSSKLNLVYCDNLVDAVWGDARPPMPSEPAMVHPVEYSGKSSEDKIAAVREEMEKNNVEGFVAAALDEVAWLLNIRGNDIPYNPLVLSFVVITRDNVSWYVEEEKVSEEVRSFLQHVCIRPYKCVYDDLKVLSKEKQLRFWLDPSRSTLAVKNCLVAETLFESNSPIAIPKAAKNEVEVNGLRNSSLRDSVALVKYYAWLEREMKKGATTWNEVSVAQKLLEFRREQELFVSPSFETISSSGPNGAIIHYAPKEGSCASVERGQMYLCDSGGQYKDGTTDVTRTFHFGEPTEHQRRCFTRVLQGHIDLAKAVFPDGTSAHKLDVLARVPLWQDGLDYKHGTGHGFGSFLNVHEGPTLIHAREGTKFGMYFATPLKPNMTVTIEPGYYEAGAFGIRIENCCIVRKVDTPHQFGGKEYYGFEELTLVPIQTKLIDFKLLDESQRAWLTAYHERVRESIAPFVEGEDLEWLMKNTETSS